MHFLKLLKRDMKWTMTRCCDYPNRFHEAREMGLAMATERGLTPDQTRRLLRYKWVAGDMSRMY